MDKLKAKIITNIWKELLGEISSDHKYFSISLIRLLGEGSPLSVQQFEGNVNISIRRIKKLFTKRPLTRFNDKKEICGHGPISVNETNITLTHADRKLYANSAWESLCISEVLNLNFKLTTKCAFSQEEIIIKTYPVGYETELGDVMVSFLPPDDLTVESLSNISEWSFFIKNYEMGEKWIEKHPNMLLIPLSIAYQSSRNVADEIYGLNN